MFRLGKSLLEEHLTGLVEDNGARGVSTDMVRRFVVRERLVYKEICLACRRRRMTGLIALGTRFLDSRDICVRVIRIACGASERSSLESHPRSKAHAACSASEACRDL